MKKQFGPCSHLVQFKERQKNWEKHEKKIQHIKSSLSFHNTSSSSHIKKQPLAQFNRIFTMDIQNKALLKRITNVPSQRISWLKPKKLIKSNRKQYYENYKQTKQNVGLLKRIRQCKSGYKMQDYKKDRKLTERYLNSICKYGYKNYVPTKTILKQNNYGKANVSQDQKGKETEENTERININKESSLRKVQSLIEERQINLGSEVVKVKGIVWSNKISLEIQESKKDKYQVELEKEIFKKKYLENIEMVLKDFLQLRTK